MKPEALNALQIIAGVAILLFIIIIGTVTANYLKKSSKLDLESKNNQNDQDKLRQDKFNQDLTDKSKESLAPKEDFKIKTNEIQIDKIKVAEEKANLGDALLQTRKNLWGRIQSLFGETKIAQIEDIEEILYTSDLGPQTVERLLSKISETLSNSEKKNADSVKDAIKKEMLNIFAQTFSSGELISSEEDLINPFYKFEFTKPSVWMVVGVNGAGKTTSIGKIASRLAQEGKRVLVAAGDTFRAAAGAQLQAWTDRAQVEIFSPQGVTDPSAVAFDAVNSGKAKGYDVIIIDTAGRLHTQQNLMEEIKKMKRVIQKVIPEAPHEVLLVLDANQGQNALMQAKEFHKSLQLTGVVLTKMDGTAKGGVAIGVTNELQVPIKLIGVGEKINDLRPFSPKSFVESIIN